MAEKHLTDGTTALAGQPRVIKIEAAEKPENARLRVAAYTRVSSDSDDQLNSFAAQNRYYAELISGKAEWRMVDIYADEGITGTSAAKREDFQRMMADCRRGLIDQILVKSISRFARNTKDCLEAVRELKELGVNVRFGREGIDTANVSSEFITAIYAAFAQKESESISGNMRWSYQRRMESGEFNTCRAPWGFRLDGKSLAVHEEEAEIVRRIFLEYLSGRNPREIAEILNAEDTSRRMWKYKAVDYILQNERYAGNALLQKRYTTATLPKQQKINRGEREMYYVADSNDAIIPQELFDRAKELRQRRSVGQAVTHGRLCVRMRCSCGSRIRAKQVNGRWYWCCCRHDEKGDCTIKPVPEAQTDEAFCRLFYSGEEKEEEMKLGGGFTFPIQFPLESPMTIFQIYLSQLQNANAGRIDIFGYSGENDQHINRAIAQNPSIREIHYYCAPAKVSDPVEEFEVASRFSIKAPQKLMLESWNTIWNIFEQN